MRFLQLSLASGLFLLQQVLVGQDAVRVASQYSASVVMVVSEDRFHQPIAMGSGIIVSNGKIITNYHVVEGAATVYAKTSTGKKLAVDGMYGSEAALDLICLSAPSAIVANVQVSTKVPVVGERIYAIGNPEGLSNTISEGIVSAMRQVSGQSLIQITAPISPGSSGGPIINNGGEVIGIAVGAITSGQNLNFAIPISQAQGIMSSSAVLPLKTTKRKANGTSERTVSLTEEVRVVEVQKNHVDYSSNYLPNGGEVVMGVSIRNNTSYSISRIRVLLILYTAANEPVDSKEVILCYTDRFEVLNSRGGHNQKPCEPILPGLAKQFPVEDIINNGRVGQIQTGEKFVTRILGFDIQEE